MAKLFFYYGAMGSSKTADALMTAFKYQERGMNVLLVKPETDTRDGINIIKSRVGLQMPCISVQEFGVLSINELKSYQCIIIDEAQFLAKSNVQDLFKIVDIYNIPVMCYGLRTDYQGNLFTGSEALLAAADIIEEIKTVCWCGKKATYNARYDEHGMILDGEVIDLGANERYIGVCRKHFFEEKLFGNYVYGKEKPPVKITSIPFRRKCKKPFFIC